MKNIIERIAGGGAKIATYLSIAVKSRLAVAALAALAAGGAWAVVPTPTAVWDGNFSTTKVNGWTLNANGNTVASDKSTITITSKGFTITPTTAVAPGTGVTVLVKMSGVSQNANNDQILVCAKQSDQNVMTGTSLCAGAMTLHGAWYGAAKWDNANNAETTFSVPSSGEFYILFANGDANGYVREGVYANGTINTKEISGLRASGTGYDVGMITIGGRPASDSEKASNAVISRVMIYEGNLTQQQMKDAIDDMETTKSYSLQCQGSGNKGGLNWANFQLPYLTHYVESGSASLNTDKALRQITIPWRPDGTVNDSGATSLYLGITDSSGKLLALSSGADMSTVTTTSSSTFDFSQAYLSAGTQYRYWFLNSDSYSLGDMITEGILMGCALYSIESNDAAMWTNTMGQGNPHCPAARFWCSNMTESEFTATAGGTAVSTSGAYADDITLKGVADGKFTLGGALNAARITLADAAATIEMDSGDSIKAQYLDNSSQKLVIDASNGATAFGTYTLFEGNLASVADANLEVTFPSLGSGYELYTTKTANKISYQVDRTAVNATLTLTADCNFSEVKDSIDWIDSNHSTLEIVNNQESPITLTFDENITAGSITVSGTGTTIIESSNSAVITAGTVTIPSGSTIDATGSAITTCTGSGTFVWKAGYPTTVPAGVTYRYVGSNDSANPVAIAGVTVTGTLKTSGYTSLTSLVIDAAGTLDILSESTSVTTAYRSNGAGNLSGTIVVESGATLVNGGTDTLDWAGSPTVDVYGTLAMGTTRWSVPGGCTFNLRAGAQVTGTGDSLASLDFINGVSKGLDVYGSARVEGKVRVRANETRIWIAENSTLVLANGIADGGGHAGGFKQVGPGTLEIHANSTGLSGNASIMTQGTLRLADTTLAFLVELQGNSSYLEVVATEAATVVPVNIASIANNNVTFSGAGKVNGTITKTSAPGGNLATALQSSAWTGTFVADWAGAHGTQFDANAYGNANSVVEVTKLVGGYVSAANANVTVVPTIKVSGFMNLENGYSGKITTLTKLTGSGVFSNQTYSVNVTTLDNFTGTLVPLIDSQYVGMKIDTINLSAAPNYGDKIVNLGDGANIGQIANTKVSVNGVVDESFTGKLEVKADGIYVKSLVTVTVPAIANTTVTVTVGGETIGTSASNYDVVSGSLVTVTYAAAAGYQVSGTTVYTINTANSETTFTPSATQVAQIVAQISGGSSYTTLQAAIDAVTQNKDIVLLANAGGATVSREITFNVVPGEYTYGDIVAEGDYILTVTTPTENKTRYSFAPAVIAVTINDVRTLYSTMTASTGFETANAGPIGTTIEILSDDPAAYVEHLPMFDLENGVFTKVANPVAAVYQGVIQQQVYRTLAEAIEAATAVQTVKLLANVALGATVSVSKTLVIDLNGYAITASGINAITTSGALTIQGPSGSISVTSGGSVVLTDAAATLTVSGVTLSPTPTTSVANHHVVNNAGVYSVALDQFAVTIPNVANTTVSVTYTSGGIDQVATAAGNISVDYGTDVTATWTAASGYRITDGASQTINPVVAAQTLTPPTVEERAGAAVSGVTFTYGEDYATARVTATVTGDASSATLTYGGNTYNAQVSNGTATFTDVTVPARGADIYAPVDYTIDTDAHTTTGGAGKTIAADVYGWIVEDIGHPEATGTWETDIAYDGTTAAATIVDNTYTPTSHPTNDVVTITVKNVVYPELSDETEILTDAQAAICLGTNGTSEVVFKVLVTNGTDAAHWEASGVTAAKDVPYDIAMTFDYTKGTYSATVNGTALTADGATSWGLCKSATSVSNIEFMGSGSIKGIQGTGLEGNMIVDGKGNKYATIQAAIDALTADATLAPLTKLHAGTPPEGWRFDGNTLIKIAKGMFFFAF